MSLADFPLPVDSKAIYPAPDLSTTDVLRKPKWAGDTTHEQSGFKARIGYWEWDLVYSNVRELAPIEEFFHARPPGGGFLYRDIDSNHAVLQNLGCGDGDSRRFRLVSTVAKVGGIVMLEPIGWPDAGQPFQVFIAGKKLSRTRYVVRRDERGHPFGDHFLDLATPPAEGQAVSVSMRYFFAVGFPDGPDFLRRLRDLHSVTLQSRPTARWPAT